LTLDVPEQQVNVVRDALAMAGLNSPQISG